MVKSINPRYVFIRHEISWDEMNKYSNITADFLSGDSDLKVFLTHSAMLEASTKQETVKILVSMIFMAYFCP